MSTRSLRLSKDPQILSAADPSTVSRAASILRDGGIVAIPTDTVYGLAASLARPDAIDRIYDLKSRPDSKAIPILLSDLGALDQVAKQTPPMMARLAARFWPGALTLVVEAREGLSEHVTTIDATGRRTVAVRIPDHPIAREIIEATGGLLAVTSANKSGETAATSAEQICSLGTMGPDAIVDGGSLAGGVPSTIVSIVDSELAVLREGALPSTEILAFLQSSETGFGSERVGAV